MRQVLALDIILLNIMPRKQLETNMYLTLGSAEFVINNF